MVILGDGAFLGKHDAEETQFGSALKQKRWNSSSATEDKEKQVEELLEWELDQEKWTEKSDAALLDDPQWQRVGIGRVQSTSPFSDEERQVQSNKYCVETIRPPRTPTRSHSQNASEPFFLEDQRHVQQPLSPLVSPGLSVRGAHQIEAALSPSNIQPPSPSSSVRSTSLMAMYNTPEPNYLYSPKSQTGTSMGATLSPSSIRPPSPSPSVRSTSSMARYNSPEPNYIYSPKSQTATSVGGTHIYGQDSSFKVFGQETLETRMRSFSPHEVNQQSSPVPSRYEYVGPSASPFLADGDTRSHIASPRDPTPTRSASWHSVAPMSPQVEADQLEAEFARLESGRGQGLAFPDAPTVDERDERNVMGYEMEDLEQEYELIEIRNKEAVPMMDEEVPFLEEVLSDGVIHLEDQSSLGDDDEVKVIEEVDERVRRKEALMRTCSMDSNEADDILGDTSVHAPKDMDPRRVIPTRKSRWQEKLERFERRGLAEAEANLDVSKFPRLQQIRQRRRERLKALMSIRQERAEIWNSLEANWEHMENSMATRLAADPEVPRHDPEPATKTIAITEDVVKTANDDEIGADSFTLSASETSSKEEPDKVAAVAQSSADQPTPGPSEDTQPDPITMAVKEIIEDLKEDVKAVKAGDQSTTPIDQKEGTIPDSTLSLLECMTGPESDDDKKEKPADEPAEKVEATEESADKSIEKEDPPSSFGEFITQSMSDVGTKVVKILKSVKSNEEEQQPVALQGTDTNDEDEASQLDKSPTDDAGDDESTGAAFDDDVDMDHQGCVNPIQDLLGKNRRIVVEEVESQGCINPLAHLGFGKTSNSAPAQDKDRQLEDSDYIDPAPSAGSDMMYEANQRGEVGPTESEEEPGFDIGLDASLSQGDDKGTAARKKTGTSRALIAKKSRRSKRSKQRKPVGGASVFFTLVDDLLINNILNIVDEKVVDNMAHTFGFD